MLAQLPQHGNGKEAIKYQYHIVEAGIVQVNAIQSLIGIYQEEILDGHQVT